MQNIELLLVVKLTSSIKTSSIANNVYYEAIFKWTENNIPKYGIKQSCKNLGYLFLEKTPVIDYDKIIPITDSSIILKYADLKAGTIRDIRSASGSVINTDNHSYLYCANALEIRDQSILIDFGHARNPDIEEIEVKRGKPILSITGNRSLFEIYKLNSDIEVLFTNTAN